MKRPPNILFIRTPEGQKTAKMLEVEKRLGRTLEEDFREYYVEKGWGQIRLSKRWGLPRNTVFHSSVRNSSRCWVEMLHLPVLRDEVQPNPPASEADHRLKREVCEEYGENFDAAHWVSGATGGGTQSFNILRLCPNCHRRLDRDDPTTTERAKEALLFREVRRILATGRDSNAKQKELVKVCEAIVTRKII